MMYCRTIFSLIVLMTVVGVLPIAVAAAPVSDAGEPYVFQADDNLARLAEKYFGMPQAYPAIVEATNLIIAEDNSFTRIDKPAEIHVGQKVFVPALEVVPETLLTEIPLEEYSVASTMEDETAPTPEQQKILAELNVKGTPPELYNEVWLNSEPLKLADLHDKVVIVEFWTFG
jgi:hypothetical protein